VFIDCERLASNGRLIDLEKGIVGNNATISGDNGTLKVKFNIFLSVGRVQLLVYLFNLEDITRNNLGSFNLEEAAITKDNCLKSECLFQFVDNGSGLVFLDETNSRVKKEQSANDTEIYPILKTCGENGSSLRELMLEFFFSSNFFQKCRMLWPQVQGMNYATGRWESKHTSMTNWIGPMKYPRNLRIRFSFSSFI
jgi:hypothetical protein